MSVKLRLSGTHEKLQQWFLYLEKLQEYSHIKILEKSGLYKNRGDSQIYRAYVEVELMLKFPND
ncbi:MAG: hypothetical protein RMY34_00750 [Aulosira sp. DedQUE10]|nr:hypothetical protein [Aulosira sp. DedQUE10]